MSYNISGVVVLSADAVMTGDDVSELLELAERADMRPEGCFLDFIEHPRVDEVRLKSLAWCGGGSGNSYEFFVENVLPRVRGRADLLVIWEGGDRVDGLLVRDGVVTQADVKLEGGTA
jgi:hypothetical protein